MQRIFDPTASATLPAPPTLEGQVGYFTGGVAGITTATRVRYWWLNMLQEEIMSVLAAAGITPDTTGTEFSQLLQALQTLNRIKLTANATFYVNASTGNDTTGTGSSTAPWATTAHAVLVLQRDYDLAGYNVRINCTGNLMSATYINGPLVGQGTSAGLVFDGGGTAEVVVNSAACFNVDFGGMATVQNFGLLSTTGSNASGAGNCLGVNAGIIAQSGNNFGACINAHMAIYGSGTIRIAGNYTISGGATVCHYDASGGGLFGTAANVTVSLTGTPAFTAFAEAGTNGSMDLPGITFSGSATGIRYSVSANGSIATNGAGANYFPGSSAGVNDGTGSYS